MSIERVRRPYGAQGSVDNYVYESRKRLTGIAHGLVVARDTLHHTQDLAPIIHQPNILLSFGQNAKYSSDNSLVYQNHTH